MQFKHSINLSIKKLFALFILTGVLSGTLTVSAQTRRTTEGSVKTKAAKSAAQTNGQPPTRETLVSEQSAAMSAAWQSGELPSPLAPPAGSPDEMVALLAKKVHAKSAESVPALLTALQLSGFFITGKDGRVLLAPADGKGQGLTVNGWEIASMAKMLGDGKTTTLAELEKTLQTIPDLKRSEIARSIISGIRSNAANDKNSYLRNWARFIVELGKNSDRKSDISVAATEDATLDAVQNFLILRRLYGDVFALGERYKNSQPRRSGIERIVPRLIDASYSKFDKAENDWKSVDFLKLENFKNFPVKSLAVDNAIPCKLDGDAPLVLDAVATALGVGFGEFTGYLENALDGTPAGDALGKYGKLVGIANILLAYAKFLQTYAALETKITLEDAPPLVRTKNAKPGAQRRLKAEVRMNIGNWQVYNCLRTAINLAGLDFATVNDGPAGGVGVTWHLDEGGGKDVYSNAGGLSGKEQIVGLTQNGGRIQDAGTSAGTGGANRVGNATYTKTDGDGIARIILEGSPQKNAKIGKVTTVMKQAKVRTTIKLKSGDLKGESVDVAGQVLGGVTGLITMPLELLYRMDWASTASLVVPVQDWEECKGGWSGTVNYKRVLTTSFSEEKKDKNYSGYFSSKSRRRELTVTGKIVLDGKPDPNIPGFAVDLGGQFVSSISQNGKTSVFITESESEVSKGGYEDNCRANETRVKTCQGTMSANAEVSASGEDNFGLNIQGAAYGFNFRLPEASGTMNGSRSGSCQGFCNEKNNGNGTTAINNPVRYDKEWVTVENQRYDPANANRLQGSWTETSRDGKTTITVTWDLQRCS